MNAMAIGLPCPHCGRIILVINFRDDAILYTSCRNCHEKILVHYFDNATPMATKPPPEP